MKTEKEARKLGIEELERRAAPMAIVDADQQEPSEPTGDDTSLPAGGGTASESVPDQPGGSDGNRSKLFHENQP